MTDLAALVPPRPHDGRRDVAISVSVSDFLDIGTTRVGLTGMQDGDYTGSEHGECLVGGPIGGVISLRRLTPLHRRIHCAKHVAGAYV